MPVACSTSALTGAEGLITFEPAGTQFCLLDHTDFPAGTSITVPTSNDFRVGDAVAFKVEGAAKVDTALTAGTTYYVVARTATSIDVSATAGGTAITLNGDGGTGTADTAGAANHISIDMAEFEPVCQVREFSIEISREELDVTTLPCSVGGASKYAAFRATQAGYASGTGTLTVYFTDDQTSLANRLLSNVMLKSQEGASVKLYINAVAGTVAGSIDDTASLLIEADISITSMSLSVNPDDPTSAELSFSITNPKNILGAVLS